MTEFSTFFSGEQEERTVPFEVEKSPEDDVQCGSSDSEKQADGTEDFQVSIQCNVLVFSYNIF